MGPQVADAAAEEGDGFHAAAAVQGGLVIAVARREEPAEAGPEPPWRRSGLRGERLAGQRGNAVEQPVEARLGARSGPHRAELDKEATFAGFAGRSPMVDQSPAMAWRVETRAGNGWKAPSAVAV